MERPVAASVSDFVTITQDEEPIEVGELDLAFTQDEESADLDLSYNSSTFDEAESVFKRIVKTPIQMQKFLQPDRSRVRIQFDADDKRVKAKMTMGLGVIKHVYSRMMESQNGVSSVIWDMSGVIWLE